MASASTTAPQTFNRYTYALNNPYKYTDPTGMAAEEEPDHVFAQLGAFGNSALEPEEVSYCTWEDCDGSASRESSPWPTSTHDEILDTALPHLRDQWMDEMKAGSKSIDVDERTGFPITLVPENAWQHGMVPGPWVTRLVKEGYTPDQAVAIATERAKKKMMAWRDDLLNQSMNDFAKGNIKASMKKFGKAMHPIMDAESPEQSWKVYSLHIIPHVELVRQVLHWRRESGPPTDAQMSRMVSAIRHHFGMTVSRDFYSQAISPAMGAPRRQ